MRQLGGYRSVEVELSSKIGRRGRLDDEVVFQAGNSDITITMVGERIVWQRQEKDQGEG